jgi:hypothetical protein
MHPADVPTRLLPSNSPALVGMDTDLDPGQATAIADGVLRSVDGTPVDGETVVLT